MGYGKSTQSFFPPENTESIELNTEVIEKRKWEKQKKSTNVKGKRGCICELILWIDLIYFTAIKLELRVQEIRIKEIEEFINSYELSEYIK